MPDKIIIDDSNYQSFVNPMVDGERMHCESYGVRSPTGFESGYAGHFSDSGIALIDESEWDDRIRQMERDQTRLIDYADGQDMLIRSQASTNYCWAFGTMRSIEYALLVAGQNVHISPASVAAPKTGFRNVGGWGDMAMAYAAQHGFNLSSEWPDTAINRRYYTQKNKELARSRVILEYFDLTPGRAGWKEMVSCILQGFAPAPGYNWWRHLVCATHLSVGDHKLGIDNSWGTNWSDKGRGWLSGSKKYADGAVVITSVTPFVLPE